MQYLIKPFKKALSLTVKSATIDFTYRNYADLKLIIDKQSRRTIKETVILKNTVGLDETFFLIPLPVHWRRNWGLLVSADGSIFTKALYSYDEKMIYCPESISIKPQDFKFTVNFIYKKTYTQPQPLFSFDLIYGGRNDVSLNINYREYTKDDLARPAFFQNLTYSADAKQIRFKDFLIQIHEVNNEKIVYTVLEDGLK